jgi:hypothetical protein
VDSFLQVREFVNELNHSKTKRKGGKVVAGKYSDDNEFDAIRLVHQSKKFFLALNKYNFSNRYLLKQNCNHIDTID